MSDQDDLNNQYRERLPVLEDTISQIKKILEDELRDLPRIDLISGRAKDPERFLEKAFRVDPAGTRRYQYPLEEIQDQIGCRVVVYYLSDVQPVADRILDFFNEFEDRVVQESDPEHFSYRARHFICQIPPDIKRAQNCPIDVFEIQVSTLFQHAWAEANHDLGYKSQTDLSEEDQRFLAFTSAQAWGADTIFAQLWHSCQEAETAAHRASDN